MLVKACDVKASCIFVDFWVKIKYSKPFANDIKFKQ